MAENNPLNPGETPENPVQPEQTPETPQIDLTQPSADNSIAETVGQEASQVAPEVITGTDVTPAPEAAAPAAVEAPVNPLEVANSNDTESASATPAPINPEPAPEAAPAQSAPMETMDSASPAAPKRSWKLYGIIGGIVLLAAIIGFAMYQQSSDLFKGQFQAIQDIGTTGPVVDLGGQTGPTIVTLDLCAQKRVDFKLAIAENLNNSTDATKQKVYETGAALCADDIEADKSKQECTVLRWKRRLAIEYSASKVAEIENELMSKCQETICQEGSKISDEDKETARKVLDKVLKTDIPEPSADNSGDTKTDPSGGLTANQPGGTLTATFPSGGNTTTEPGSEPTIAQPGGLPTIKDTTPSSTNEPPNIDCDAAKGEILSDDQKSCVCPPAHERDENNVCVPQTGEPKQCTGDPEKRDPEKNCQCRSELGLQLFNPEDPESECVCKDGAVWGQDEAGKFRCLGGENQPPAEEDTGVASPEGEATITGTTPVLTNDPVATPDTPVTNELPELTPTPGVELNPNPAGLAPTGSFTEPTLGETAPAAGGFDLINFFSPEVAHAQGPVITVDPSAFKDVFSVDKVFPKAFDPSHDTKLKEKCTPKKPETPPTTGCSLDFMAAVHGQQYILSRDPKSTLTQAQKDKIASEFYAFMDRYYSEPACGNLKECEKFLFLRDIAIKLNDEPYIKKYEDAFIANPTCTKDTCANIDKIGQTYAVATDANQDPSSEQTVAAPSFGVVTGLYTAVEPTKEIQSFTATTLEVSDIQKFNSESTSPLVIDEATLLNSQDSLSISTLANPIDSGTITLEQPGSSQPGDTSISQPTISTSTKYNEDFIKRLKEACKQTGDPCETLLEQNSLKIEKLVNEYEADPTEAKAKVVYDGIKALTEDPEHQKCNPLKPCERLILLRNLAARLGLQATTEELEKEISKDQACEDELCAIAKENLPATATIDTSAFRGDLTIATETMATLAKPENNIFELAPTISTLEVIDDTVSLESVNPGTLTSDQPSVENNEKKYEDNLKQQNARFVPAVCIKKPDPTPEDKPKEQPEPDPSGCENLAKILEEKREAYENDPTNKEAKKMFFNALSEFLAAECHPDFKDKCQQNKLLWKLAGMMDLAETVKTYEEFINENAECKKQACTDALPTISLKKASTADISPTAAATGISPTVVSLSELTGATIAEDAKPSITTSDTVEAYLREVSKADENFKKYKDLFCPAPPKDKDPNPCDDRHQELEEIIKEIERLIEESRDFESTRDLRRQLFERYREIVMEDLCVDREECKKLKELNKVAAMLDLEEEFNESREQIISIGKEVCDICEEHQADNPENNSRIVKRLLSADSTLTQDFGRDINEIEAVMNADFEPKHKLGRAAAINLAKNNQLNSEHEQCKEQKPEPKPVATCTPELKASFNDAVAAYRIDTNNQAKAITALKNYDQLRVLCKPTPPATDWCQEAKIIELPIINVQKDVYVLDQKLKTNTLDIAKLCNIKPTDPVDPVKPQTDPTSKPTQPTQPTQPKTSSTPDPAPTTTAKPTATTTAEKPVASGTRTVANPSTPTSTSPTTASGPSTSGASRGEIETRIRTVRVQVEEADKQIQSAQRDLDTARQVVISATPAERPAAEAEVKRIEQVVVQRQAAAQDLRTQLVQAENDLVALDTAREQLHGVAKTGPEEMVYLLTLVAAYFIWRRKNRQRAMEMIKMD